MVNPYLVTNYHEVAAINPQATAKAFGIGMLVGSAIALCLSLILRRYRESQLGLFSCLGLFGSTASLAFAGVFSTTNLFCVVTVLFGIHRASLNTMTACGRSIHVMFNADRENRAAFVFMSLFFHLVAQSGQFSAQRLSRRFPFGGPFSSHLCSIFSPLRYIISWTEKSMSVAQKSCDRRHDSSHRLSLFAWQLSPPTFCMRRFFLLFRFEFR